MTEDEDQNFACLASLEASVRKEDLLPGFDIMIEVGPSHSETESLIGTQRHTSDGEKFYPSHTIVTNHKKKLSASGISIAYETITLGDSETYKREITLLTKSQKEICNKVRMSFRNIISAQKTKRKAKDRVLELQMKVKEASETNEILRAKRKELKAFKIYQKTKLRRALIEEKFRQQKENTTI